MKKLIMVSVLLVSANVFAKPVYTTSRPAGDIGAVEAVKIAANGGRPWECVEQELTHKAKLKNASGADKTYHGTRPGSVVSKGAALKATLNGGSAFACSEKTMNQSTGSLTNY